MNVEWFSCPECNTSLQSIKAEARSPQEVGGVSVAEAEAPLRIPEPELILYNDSSR